MYCIVRDGGDGTGKIGAKSWPGRWVLLLLLWQWPMTEGSENAPNDMSVEMKLLPLAQTLLKGGVGRNMPSLWV